MNREEAIQRMIDIRKYCQLGAADSLALSMGIDALMQKPRETARWFFDDITFKTVCSNCGEGEWKGYVPTPAEADKWMPFCPKCGAEMIDDIPMEYYESGGK